MTTNNKYKIIFYLIISQKLFKFIRQEFRKSCLSLIIIIIYLIYERYNLKIKYIIKYDKYNTDNYVCNKIKTILLLNKNKKLIL